MLFHKVEGAACVLRCKGVYKQVDVYHRDHVLYAKAAGGFISLKRSNGTSKPDIAWEHIDGIEYEEVGFNLERISSPRVTAQTRQRAA